MSVRSVKARKKKAPKNNGTSTNGAVKQHNGTLLKRDRDLVRRCLKGDVAAWQEMFDRCQPHLLASIGSLLKPYGLNTNLAEEIASRVWFSLVGANGSLLDRFDAHRGCQLTTFISALARHELLMYWRTEKRQRKREQAAMIRRPSVHPNDADCFQIVWDEFVATLTQRERSFLEDVLLVPSATPETENLSQTNFWQLRSRVTAKLKLYSSNGNA
jgi:DNA-directed RNA polymerase specialized sigma24 family protein